MAAVAAVATVYKVSLDESIRSKRGSPGLGIPKRSTDSRYSPKSASLSIGGAARNALSQERPLETPLSTNILKETYQFSANGNVFSMPTHEVIVTCNKLAMTSLSQENFKECQIFLKRAEYLVAQLQEKMEQLGIEGTS